MIDIADLIRVRRDFEWNFEEKNKVYANGEILAITDKRYLKIGNGIDDFKTLGKYGGDYDEIMAAINEQGDLLSEQISDVNCNLNLKIENLENEVQSYTDISIVEHNTNNNAHSLKFAEKFDAVNAISMFKNVTYNSTNGNMIFTKYDNTTITIVDRL